MNFSVIIPLYNKADTVERAVRSVFKQTCRNFEIVVVDDGSLDNGVEKVQKIHDPCIRLIQQVNGGVSAARNTGVANAKYDFVTFLDADDEYLPDYLETLDRLIQRCSDTAIWGTGYTFQLPDGRQVNPHINGLPADFEGYLPNYFEIASNSAPPLWTGAVCIRKAALQKIGGFPVGIRSGEDLLTWARLCAENTLAYTMHSCSLYYLNRQQAESTRPTRIPQTPDMVGEQLSRLYYRTKKSGLRKYCSLWHKMRASSFIRSGYHFRGFSETCKALFWNPSCWKLYLYLPMSFIPAAWICRLFANLKRKK